MLKKYKYLTRILRIERIFEDLDRANHKISTIQAVSETETDVIFERSLRNIALSKIIKISGY